MWSLFSGLTVVFPEKSVSVQMLSVSMLCGSCCCLLLILVLFVPGRCLAFVCFVHASSSLKNILSELNFTSSVVHVCLFISVELTEAPEVHFKTCLLGVVLFVN